ncbi:MAG: signal peptide peptidase SppA [Syntrophales bacterium]|nr:signal peptide peptidase SppA [Syntrophales bacterium]
MRKHPVLLGILLLTLLGGVFFSSLFIVGLLGGKRQAISTREKVGVLNIEGIITASKEINRQIEELAEDDRVKAVVVRIDSPGGGVTQAEEIYGALQELRKKKKVVASMGAIAASGGYLIACASDRIVSNPGTITGSLSAVMHFANAEALLKKVGLQTTVIKSGKYKDIGSPTREMTEEEKALLQGLVDDIYDHLLDVIAKDRKISKEDLQKLADGRIFSGRQAKALGLVDELGDLQHAIQTAGKMAGLKEKPGIVYPTKKKSPWWDLVLRGAISSLMAEWRGQEMRYWGPFYLYMPDGGRF